mgnify:CR=1 FL=1
MPILADVGMERNIHPLYKEPVADRLCRLALEDVYGIPAQAHAARPVGHTWTTEGIQLHFNGPVELREGERPCLWPAELQAGAAVARYASFSGSIHHGKRDGYRLWTEKLVCSRSI